MDIKEIIRNVIVFLITLEAKAVLKKYKPQIIVVSGSVGKTSTKDATYTAFKGHTFVRKSEKNYNGDIGVPITILGVPNGWTNMVQWMKNLIDGLLLLLVTTPYPRWLILEVGADRPGDISKSLAWLKPDVVVTTRFPDVPVHVEFYDSPEAVIEEEMYPLKLLKEGGVAVLNYDDPRTKDAVLPPGVTRLTYGSTPEADIYSNNIRMLSEEGRPRGISFDIHYKEEKERGTVLGVLGDAPRESALAGVAASVAGGASFKEAVAALEKHVTPAGRLRLIPSLKGGMVIDDTYNASPAATEAALEALHTAPGARKIAIVGDMLELGQFSLSEHERIGEVAAGKADLLCTVGVRAKGIAEGARKAGMNEDQVHTFERGSDAAAFVLNMLQEKDVVLVKGSQSMRMERVVKSLMAEPEKAKELLPRQDSEWLARS